MIAVVLWIMLQVLVGRVALIFSVVMTKMQNNWKTCQQQSLLRPPF